MENDTASLPELLAQALPSNPLVSALLASPLLADASRQAISELGPVVERTLKGLRVTKLTRATPAVLVSSFAAGMVVGWFTAPAIGSEMRARTRERLRHWTQAAGARARAGRLFLSKRLSRKAATSTPEPEATVDVEEAGANGEGQVAETARH